MSYTKDIEHFEYDKRYFLPSEHRWCFLKDREKAKEYFDKKDEEARPVCGRVQSDPETTGQWGPLE